MASQSIKQDTENGQTSGQSVASEDIVAVVIPCFREKIHILDVLSAIGDEIDRIYVVDDACPDKTGVYVREHCMDARVVVLSNPRNTGVGGATLAGYRQALDDGAQIIVKLDGDGQMNPSMIPELIAPIQENTADYTKGNRFHSLQGITGMPKNRLFGNFVLSLVSKFSSGYWNIFDPTNGFTAIHSRVAKQLSAEKISQRYFFESDILYFLGMLRAVVVDVPMQAQYGTETSGIRIPRVIPEFIFKHSANTCKRIFFTYFLREANIATTQLLLGNLFLLFGLIFGAVNWIGSKMSEVTASAGTAILAAVPIILGSQLLIAFMSYDVRNVPTQPIHLQKSITSKTN